MISQELLRNLTKTTYGQCRRLCNKLPEHLGKEAKVFSGIQPTGALHLGNYIGAVHSWLKYQDSYEGRVTIMIADLHSMTLPYVSRNLSKGILEMAAILLSSGLDPKRVLLFQQSSVPAHTELCWYLGCVSTMAKLGHFPQYKEKSATLKDIPLGLYVYPVLQAADILAHKSSHVPVGEDQTIHIEFAQDVAKAFNHRFGNLFPVPHGIMADSGRSRLRSLRDPEKKMSKSDPDPKSRICLSDSPEDIILKIKKSVTDFNPEITYDPVKRPGVANLINIESFISGIPPEQVCKKAAGLNTLQFKLMVADNLVEFLKPVQNRFNYYLSHPSYIEEVLNIGADKAKDITGKTMEEVRSKIGVNVTWKTDKLRVQM